MKHFNLLIATLLLFSFTACDTPDRTGDDEDGGDTVSTQEHQQGMEKNGITLTEITAFEEYENGSLKMNKPEENASLEDQSVQFDFAVQNFELGIQTPDAGEMGMANSDKGQHIHLIIDNDPYTAHYEPAFEKELEKGSHVLLAFLSRSYHMSVKNKDAYVLRNVTVGDDAGDMDFDMNGKHLFYSRPKGEYKGENATEKVLLDFYLHNVDLSEDGYKVKATINGSEFTLTKWVPYAIKGLKEGKNTIELELIDQDGNKVEGPFNSVSREITLVK